MKRLAYLFSLLLLLSCDASDSEIIVCPPDTSTVFALTVDYTTNKFLGGYTMPLDKIKESFEMVCEYKAPGDFGSIMWYDKQSETKLFAGTIVWMGKGERTFPEKISSPGKFQRLNIITKIPNNIIYLSESEYDTPTEDIDYAPIWKAVENLQCVSWVSEETPVYIYFYRPSVGIGDPKDWYWVIFLKY